jgi:tRNA A-37 threonylcarbamoyl transferase component Bud32
MSQLAADRNLLFGILAVQLDFVPRDGLVAAMNAWVLDKQKTLGHIMEEQRLLTPERRALLEALVSEHVKQHDNDPERSLRAVGADWATSASLRQISDAGVQASLAQLPAPSITDDFATRAPRADEASAAHQRFRILRPHARGGLGEVFVAEDLELHRQVALKEIQARFADDSASRTRFVLEAEVTGGLEHPGIVPVYGLGQYADGRPFYAMRFIKGDSLKEAIAQFYAADWRGREGERAVAFRELLGRFVDVCNAIAYAHSRGVLHRDLKPGNVMLGKYGETLVVDWGLAKPLDRPDRTEELDEQPLQPSSVSSSDKTVPGMALGTPQFMSPEQAAGRLDLVGPATDIYGLGATLYCVLTGRPPFTDQDTGQVLRQVRQGLFPRPRQVSRGVPRALEAICLKAMASQPTERYPDAHALADDIERWLADEPVSAYRESLAKRCRRWARRHQIAVTAAAMLLIVGLSAAWLVVRERARAAEAERQQARARVDALLHAKAEAVPRALEALTPVRDLALPALRQTIDDPQLSGAVCTRAALGLLPSDPSQIDFLVGRMLEDSDPNEVLLIRNALIPYKQSIIPGLWKAAEADDADRQRCLRALVALARYDPDDPRWATVGEKAVPGILEDNPWHLEIWTEALRPVRARLIEALVKVFRDSPDAEDRSSAAQLLATYAADQPKLLADFLLDADAKQFASLWPQVREHPAQFIPLLEAAFQPLPEDVFDPASEQLARRQAQAAVALLQLGRDDRVWPLLRHSRDPRTRSYIIQMFRPLGTDIQLLLARWPKETDISARRALVLALGTYDAAVVPAEQRQAFIKELDALFRDDVDAGLHNAIDWLRRFRWVASTRARKMVTELIGVPPGERRWFVNGKGQTFTIVPGPVEFDMGAPPQDPNRAADETLHRVRIPRSFAICNKEVPVEHFQFFLKANPDLKYSFDTLVSPKLFDPVIQVSWYQAAMYCRWLSEQEGITEDQMCFPPIAQIKSGMKLPADYLRRTGYRLPTEAEWEYACRAGAVTSRFYGNSVELLPRYAWFGVAESVSAMSALSGQGRLLFRLFDKRICSGAPAHRSPWPGDAQRPRSVRHARQCPRVVHGCLRRIPDRPADRGRGREAGGRAVCRLAAASCGWHSAAGRPDR